jgi:hypothetical protein
VVSYLRRSACWKSSLEEMGMDVRESQSGRNQGKTWTFYTSGDMSIRIKNWELIWVFKKKSIEKRETGVTFGTPFYSHVKFGDQFKTTNFNINSGSGIW